MNRQIRPLVFLMLAFTSTLFPAFSDTPVSEESVDPGTEISMGDKGLKLSDGSIEVGKPLPESWLTSDSMKDTKFEELLGEKVLLISVVPSLDTPVCEQQTHILGEEGDDLPETVERITISRDLPFAQKRFAKEAELTDLVYYSDFKEGAFGKATGLLINDLGILARAMIVVNKDGVVTYLQVVPQIGHLPDMKKAFEAAKKAAG